MRWHRRCRWAPTEQLGIFLHQTNTERVFAVTATIARETRAVGSCSTQLVHFAKPYTRSGVGGGIGLRGMSRFESRVSQRRKYERSELRGDQSELQRTFIPGVADSA